jgi:hypothetical protein
LDWRSLVEEAVWTMLVVMAHVDREDSFEVPAVHDQDPVQRHSRRAVPVKKTFS